MNKTSDIQIVKRDGSKEVLNLDKMHFVVEQACEGLSGVSASQIEMNSQIQFTNNMSTTDIQEIMIRSANDLITLETPNYQYAAARLLLWNVYKEVFKQFQPRHLIAIIDQNIKLGVYDASIKEHYTKTELKNRVSRYKTKKFVIVMSDDIPGYIYKIETFIKDLEDPDDKVKETLEFQGIRTNKELRDEYKKRKENSKS